MPKLNYQLASQGIRSNTRNGGLTAPTFNGSAGSQLSAPRINVHAADVRNTPMPVTPITEDAMKMALDGAENFADTLAKETFRFQAKQDQYYADKAVLDFSEYASNKYYGVKDQPGLANTSGEDGINAAMSYSGDINKRYQATIDSLTPAQRQKAMLRLGGVRNTALNRGATHKSRQMKVRDQELQYAKDKQISATIMKDPQNALRSTEMDMYLLGIESQEERDAAAGSLSLMAMNDAYTQEYQANASPSLAYKAAENAVIGFADKLAPAYQRSVKAQLRKMKESAMLQEKKDRAGNQKKLEWATEQRSPQDITHAFENNNVESLNNVIAFNRQVYADDPSKGFKSLVTSVKKGLFQYVENPSVKGVGSKMSIAKQAMDLTIENSNLGTDERIAIQAYYTEPDGLKKDITTAQNKRDVGYIGAYSGELIKKFKDGTPIVAVAPYDWMLPENQDAFNKLTMDMVQRQTEMLSVEKQLERKDFGDIIDAKLLDGSFTGDDMPWVMELGRDGKIGAEEVNMVMVKLGKKLTSGSKRLPYQQKQPFIKGEDVIKNYKKTRFFVGGKNVAKKDLDNEEKIMEKVELDRLNDLGYSQMIIAYNDAMKKENHMEEQEWIDDYIFKLRGGSKDGHWWTNWLKTELKVGASITPVGRGAMNAAANQF